MITVVTDLSVKSTVNISISQFFCNGDGYDERAKRRVRSTSFRQQKSNAKSNADVWDRCQWCLPRITSKRITIFHWIHQKQSRSNADTTIFNDVSSEWRRNQTPLNPPIFVSLGPTSTDLPRTFRSFVVISTDTLILLRSEAHWHLII